jgi:hypothetical protein
LKVEVGVDMRYSNLSGKIVNSNYTALL